MDSETGYDWVESEATRHCVGSACGDVWFNCDLAFKVGKDAPGQERLSRLHRLFSAMVEQVDASFGQAWTRQMHFQHAGKIHSTKLALIAR